VDREMGDYGLLEVIEEQVPKDKTPGFMDRILEYC